MKSSNLSILALTAGLLGACAPKVPAELLSARVAYDQVSAGPALVLVPAEVHKAHEALEQAEAAFAADPRGYHTRDLAYVAQRKSELAEALGVVAKEEQAGVAAHVQYETAQGAIIKGTQAELGVSQSNLAATQGVVTQTAAELAATQSSLSVSQSAQADSAQRLAASESARVVAEAQAAEAMTALAKLAAVKEESRGLVITLSGSVLFRSDEAILLPEAQTRLGQVADALMATKERSVLVEGHTDSQGTDPHNLDLSQRRAEAVRSFLVERGYEPARVRAMGVGEARPIADNGSAEGRANNRRVEIVIAPKSLAVQ